MRKSIKTSFVTATTAALATGLSRTAIYKHIRERNLPAMKMAGYREFMIDLEDLQAFIKARAQGVFTRKWRTLRKQQSVIETLHGDKTLTINVEKA
jgi:excisionase family DNA binding protein